MSKTKEEYDHMRHVSYLGCLKCLEDGYEDTPCDLHHCFTGGGGRKDHMKVIGLCPTHHRWKLAIDKEGKKRRHIEIKFLTYVAEHCGCNTCIEKRKETL